MTPAISALGWCLVLGLGGAASAPAACVERQAAVMGTVLRIEVHAATREAAGLAAEAALREVERWDRMLSTWDPASDMSRANRAPVGTEVRPGAELASLLAEAEAWARRTGRAFEPILGALLDAWDLRGAGREPDATGLRAALGATGPGGIRMDATTGSMVRVLGAAWVDTGGFGKGAALRSAGRLLASLGVERAFLDLGGQVLALGPADAPWEVAVAHPSRRQDAALRLRLWGASAATSGQSERWIEVAGARIGHILDPRTGRPAPAWGSVTVVSADPLVADILSTALYVMGPEAGMAWARHRTDAGVLFLEERAGRLTPSWNGAMEPYLFDRHQPAKAVS